MLEPKKQKADEYLRAVAATPALAGLRVLTTVRTGEAPREIIAAARELQADVIAMSTHGRTGLRRLLFGSVAEAVVRPLTFRSSCCARLTSRRPDAWPEIPTRNSYTPSKILHM
jgi:hypothetical protein